MSDQQVAPATSADLRNLANYFAENVGIPESDTPPLVSKLRALADQMDASPSSEELEKLLEVVERSMSIVECDAARKEIHALFARTRKPEEPRELSVICRECGTLISGVEAGTHVRWVTCRKCAPSDQAGAVTMPYTMEDVTLLRLLADFASKHSGPFSASVIDNLASRLEATLRPSPETTE